MIWVLIYLAIGCVFTALIAVPHMQQEDASTKQTPDWFVVGATLLAWPVLFVATTVVMVIEWWKTVP